MKESDPTGVAQAADHQIGLWATWSSSPS